MGELPGALIWIAGLPNLRDIGGWAAHSGRVRMGLLYRSVDLSRLGSEGLDAFADLGIRTVYDLRTGPERAAGPDRVPEGTQHVVADVLADAADAAPAQLVALLSDPDRAAAELGGGKAAAMFQHGYREIVSLPSALAAYRQLYTTLAQPENRPALIHCTTGKDRTGWGAAALLMLLGVSDEDVMRDYLLTNDGLLPALQPVFDQFRAAGGDPELLKPILGVQQRYLQAALEEMRARFGSIEGYFRDGLGIDADVQQTLRAAFTGQST